jgi:hydrogenase/urease accessory protein HupE
MRTLLTLLFFALVSIVSAHESRPAYLEIKETAPSNYNILWRTPVLSGNRLPVVLNFPDGVETIGEPITQRLSDSIIERRKIETKGSELAGQRFDFVGLQATITDVLVRVQWLDGGQSTTIIRPAEAWINIPEPEGTWSVAREYGILGIEHILLGIDHLLFVLALLLITKGTMRLIKTITAFTIAHSITLGLAALGFTNVPIAPVEAVIALSIVFVAVEIIHARRGIPSLTARSPWIVAFSFGLLHGFGFAGALGEIGLPPGHIPTALLFFNVGVELGQLMFVGVILALIAVLRRIRLPLPRWAELVPPYAIGSIAMFWVIERVMVL